MPNKRWIIHQRPLRRRQQEQQADHGLPNSPASHVSQRCGPPASLRGRDFQFKPAIYHCVSRVVDRRFIFGPREKDRFIEIMRKAEEFAGIQVLAHCVMSNHFHILVEITPMPEEGLRDEELLSRLAALYDEPTVDAVANELENARIAIAEGRANGQRVEAIHARYTYRMHDLSEFMKTLIQRFTQWYNRKNERTGNLWEDVFRSSVVESGSAARLVAAYIDLNPVRAGIVEDPADYPWSSYGEATAKSPLRGKPSPTNLRARAGLVRAFFAHQGTAPDATRWKDCLQIYLPWIGQAMARMHATRTGKPPDHQLLQSPGAALTGRIRHFIDGVVVGSRGYIEQFFEETRDRFSAKRTTGARPIRGNGAAMTLREGICSLRDLQKNIGS